MKKQGSHSILFRDVVCVLGLPFDVVNLAEASAVVLSSIENKQPCFLTTPNLNFLITAQSDEAFFQSVIESDLIVADGMPIIWIAKLLGLPLTERVAGSDLFNALSIQERSSKTSVFFFGGLEGIAEQASKKLNEASQGMSSCGFYDPGFVSVDKMGTPTIIDYINEATPDFLLVALGASKGQKWIQRNRKKLNSPLISHLGAVVNFVAGHVVRAPTFWQKTGLEWLWRIKQEPGLWKRYFFDGLAFVKLFIFKVFPLAVYDRWLRKSNDFKAPVNISYESTSCYLINLKGSIHRKALKSVKQHFVEILQAENLDVKLNCSGLVYIDSAFIASLMLFQGVLSEQGRQLYLYNVPKRIVCLMELNNVLCRFIISDHE